MNLEVTQKLTILIVGWVVDQSLDQVVGEGDAAVGARKTFDSHVTNLDRVGVTYSLRKPYMHSKQMLCISSLILTISASTTSK